MFKTLFIAVLLAAALNNQAQIIKWRSGSHDISVASMASLMVDSAKNLTIQDIITPATEIKFLPSNQDVIHLGFSDRVVWLRFSVDNPAKEQLCLVVEHAFIPEATLYFKDSQLRWDSVRSGYEVPLFKKAIVDHFQVFDLPAYTTTYYLKMSPLLHAVPVSLLSKGECRLNAYKRNLGYGIYTGILMFAIVTNLFLYAAFQKMYFLNYSILVFFYWLTSALVLDGYGIYLFPVRDMMFWYKTIPVVDMVAFLFYCISFFELKTNHPRLYQISFYSALFFMVYLIAVDLFPLLAVLALNQFFALGVFVLGTIIGIRAGSTGNRLGYLFALSYTFWFILILLEAIYIQTGKPKHFSAVSHVSTASFIEAFLLAFLQIKRFQWEKKADQLHQFELERKMEKMEEEFQREMLHTRLEIQEQTLNTVSQEIHDNVGQQLSLAKVQVGILDNKTEKDPGTLTELKETISQALADLRNIAKNLSNYYASNQLLKELVANIVKKINRVSLIDINLVVEGDEKDIEPQKKLVVYRIIQECLQNIIKHSKASRAVIVLDYRGPKLGVTVTDNGIGFNPKQVSLSGDGLGLENIVGRASMIGGSAIIKSEINKGSCIQITAPYE